MFGAKPLSDQSSKKTSPRVILVSGKGGVGKTTVASATGVACAKRGLRTLVMSIDIAHSLSDAFGIEGKLLNIHEGLPYTVRENLDIQEVDLQAEIERHWGDLFAAMSGMLKSSGMNDVLAEELAILPGMAEVVCLLYVSKYLTDKTYDVIILDSAPTGESLRFISMPSTIEWSLQKIYRLKQNVPSIAKPILRIMGGVSGEEMQELEKLQDIYRQLNEIRAILIDNTITSVRLVCNPERMVINETLRAYMYFCLYGMNVDMVAINRIVPPEADNGYFTPLLQDQAGHIEELENHFAPALALKARRFRRDIYGIESLEELADEMFAEHAPEAIHAAEPPYAFLDEDGEKVLRVKLPGIERENVDLFNEADELVIRIGNFKRHVYLPRAYANLTPAVAQYKNDALVIRFEKTYNGREEFDSAAIIKAT